MGARDHKLALQPSSAPRWITCTASPLYIVANAAKIPEERDTEYSREGTVAHDRAAGALTYGSSEILEADDPVKIYVDHILEILGDAVLTVEEKRPLWYMGERNGQIDASIHQVEHDTLTRLEVHDYKHGKGVPVDAVENEQLAIYGRNIVADLEGLFTIPRNLRVRLVIHQPRIRGLESPRSVWELTVEELIAFTDPIEQTALLIMEAAKGDPFALECLEFAPSDATCQFCPMKKVGCAARTSVVPPPVASVLGLPTAELSVVDKLRSGTLTAEQIGLIAANGPALIKWVKDVMQGATEALLRDPKSVPGCKLVTSRGGHRKWLSEEEALRILQPRLGKSAVVVEEIMSPAQVEELMARMEKTGEKFSTRFRNLLEANTTKGGGVPVLAPLADPRPAITSATDHFEALPDEDQ